MLWYLLSPIRGTSQPPRLSATHPIRRAFYRHGKTTAQHWLVAMLVSVAIAMGFSYPTILLSENPTAGFAAYPHTFWTSAKPIDHANASVDMEMRQIWVHGSYMEALNKDVLKRALAVQQSLIGEGKMNPAVTDELHPDTLQWGFHSPLMYWNNSENTIDADTDLLRTINDQRNAHSLLNVVLRPASVFAGKKFDKRRLLAADALVITLMNKASDSAGNDWQRKMQSLTLSDGACSNCTSFPHDGHVTRKRVYEFRFTPLSFPEHIALTFAYSFMALYVLLSLRRMKAFHSRFGLVVTAITQMTCSILASFTICGILKINLSMVPQNAYPFVVLVLGVENMFRLINAILNHPPTMATELRIANALGDVGPISVAAAAQNLAILALLSTFVSPGVAAFCAFASIATIFDVFFLLTFFVAVLNVDIKRLELQDALSTRHSQPRRRKRQSPSRHSWFDALVQGRLPFSTRMAGTAVTTAFVLSLNYHFFEHKEKSTNFRHLLDLVRGGPQSVSDLETFAPPPMNASLTPAEWLRMQDFDTAKEVMRLVKPGAESFVVRVFAPLVIVLGGSDRNGVAQQGNAWTHALRSLAVHHFYPVSVAIVFAVAFVAVLMNFLLYNEAGDEDNDMQFDKAEDRLFVHTLRLPHRLDVVKMASSDTGHFVTVALDRTIAISKVDRATQSHQTIAVPSKVSEAVDWPIQNLAIDDTGDWIACHCANDSILAFNRTNSSFIPNLVQYPDDHPAVIFAFVSLPAQEGESKLHFIALTSGGRMSMSCLDDGLSTGADLTTTSLVGAAIVDTAQARKLVLVTDQAEIISFSWNGLCWNRTAAHNMSTNLGTGLLTGTASIQLYTDVDLELIVVKGANTVAFLDSASLIPFTTLELAQAGEHVENVLLGALRKCPSCSGPALRSIAALITTRDTQERVLTTWRAEDDVDCFCLVNSCSLCLRFDGTANNKEAVTIDHPDAWTPVKSETILGIRRRRQKAAEQPHSRRMTATQLRQRRHARQQSQHAQEVGEEWEAYKISIDGGLEVANVSPSADSHVGDETALYVNTAGPIAALDPQAVAVAFGNTVRIVRSSRRGSISRLSAGASLERQSSTSRRATPRRTR